MGLLALVNAPHLIRVCNVIKLVLPLRGNPGSLPILLWGLNTQHGTASSCTWFEEMTLLSRPWDLMNLKAPPDNIDRFHAGFYSITIAFPFVAPALFTL